MRKFFILGILLAASLPLLATESSAAVCARGARGGACIGPRGGVVVGRRGYIAPRRSTVAVRGPRGGAVIHRRGF